VEWTALEKKVKAILSQELPADGRAAAWNTAMSSGALGPIQACVAYDSSTWLGQIEAFRSSADSQGFIQSHPYKFFVAADYHRNYVLKRLLPGFDILVA
jgi:hypothetical protein